MITLEDYKYLSGASAMELLWGLVMDNEVTA